MDWQNERYVRIYTRDTVTRKVWTWEARAIWDALMRKLDRAGVMDIGEFEAAEAVAAMLDIPIEVVSAHLPSILKSKAIVVVGPCVVAPNFVEAQEANQSDKQRQAESRARRKDKAMRGDILPGVTERDEMSHAVTDSHTESHRVTPSLAVPSLAKPSQAKENTSAPAAEVLTYPPVAYELAQYLFDAIRSHDPDFEAAKSPSELEKKLTGWAKDFDLLTRKDKKAPEDVRRVIDHCHRSREEFNRGKVQCGSKLRKRWNQLWSDAKGPAAKGNAIEEFDFVGAGKAWNAAMGVKQ